MKIACICYTNKGYETALKIKNGLKNADIYRNRDIDGGIKTVIKDIFYNYDALVFVSACGIAVRMIAPFIKDKRYDPAVVVVDDTGKFAVSLLSGHIGGANELACRISEVIGSISVITTASDGRNIESIDMFAKRNNLHIESMEDAKNITAIMVNGGKIKFSSEIDAELKYPYFDNSDYNGAVYVTCMDEIKEDKPYVILRPEILNIGIGCRKGKTADEIINAVCCVFNENNLSLKSIKSVSTVEVKKHEEGIIKACEHFNCPLNIFSISQIDEVKDDFEKSEFVEKTIGVPSVAEPCACLGGGRLIVKKAKLDGITIAVAMEV